jgi:hypothetical protein
MALDWASRVTALNGLSLIGADDRNRDSMSSRLTGQGTAYDAARSELGPAACDAAKLAGDLAFAAASSSWATATEPVHERADACARFILGSGAPIAFLPDGSAQAALTTRMSEASTALKSTTHPKRSLAEELDAHEHAVLSAYSARPVVPTYGPPYTTRTPILGAVAVSKDYNLHEFERDVLGPLIAEADLLLAELAFT